MPGRLDGKSVIITGASSGQGRVAAQRFAEEGARLVLADKDDEGLTETEALIKPSGAELLVHSGDLTQEDVNEAMVALAVKSYGGLNAIYTPAGLVKFASADELTLDDWKFVVDFELTMTFLACKHALRAMKDSGGGSIINVSSVSGIRGSKRHAAHAATKMGVVGLTRQIAVEYGPQAVRCNAIAPGYIAYAPGQLRVARQSTNNPQTDAIPLRRHCAPEDTANAALFLASDESSFISGQVIVVDGAASIS